MLRIGLVIGVLVFWTQWGEAAIDNEDPVLFNALNCNAEGKWHLDTTSPGNVVWLAAGHWLLRDGYGVDWDGVGSDA